MRDAEDPNEQCSADARPGSILCGRHGANLPDMRREAAERIALARLTSLNTVILAVEEAVGTYLTVMRHGDKGSDRIKAADRVLELAGMPLGKPLVDVKIDMHGLRPDEDPRDSRLLSIIERLDAERATLLKQRAIDVVAQPREETA